MKKRLRILIPILVIVLAVVAWLFFFNDNGDGGNIRLSGNIDVTQADLAFKIPGRLSRRSVDEGVPVSRGQVLAVLDDIDQRLQYQKAVADLEYAASVLAELEAGSRPEEIERARARVEQARFVLSELRSGSRQQEIAEAEADLQRTRADERAARSELELARADFSRYRAVHENGGISQQTFETYRTRLTTAENAVTAAASRRRAAQQRLSLRREGSRSERISQARSALNQAEAEYALIEAGPRKEAIDQARAKEEAAAAALAIAKQRLTDTRLTASFDGVVLSTSAEPGVYLNPGTTVLTVGDIQNVWLRAFINETDLSRIRLGQSAEVSVDGYAERRWPGRVSFISSTAEFTPRSVQTDTERTNLVYRIKIQLENADGALKPGMPADAVIEAAP
ncbi:MAG TPA: efflux RND transporter periplasmic adaptor subunit [Desulfosarcina sp.]|nr:efflux RND transporter periplasmic adaptor subunit [Desulfosarcina sp.]